VTLVAPVGGLNPPLPSFIETLLTVNGSTARLSSRRSLTEGWARAEVSRRRLAEDAGI